MKYHKNNIIQKKHKILLYNILKNIIYNIL